MKSPIEFDIAERIVHSIAQNTDPNVSVLKEDVEQEFVKLTSTYDMYMSVPDDDYPQQIKARLQLSLGVSQFASRAYRYFLMINCNRAFDDEERLLGKDLSRLHGQGMELIRDRV